jgi:hypothetical protein
MYHEFWRIVASGLADTLLADYKAVTSRDARTLLEREGAFLGKFKRTCYDSMAYVPSGQAVAHAMDLVVNREYDPSLSFTVPRPTGAKVTSGTISCDTPPVGYTAYLFSWNYTSFTEIGALSANQTPGAGVYVVSLRLDESGEFGAPSAFLAIT